MLRALPLLALMCVPAPEAFAAFPPCPKAPLRLSPLEGGTPPLANEAPWFRASYTEVSMGTPTPKAGKCEDRRPVPEDNLSSGKLLLYPQYAPKAEFGVIALPELPKLAVDGLSVEYALDFDIDSAPPANVGDWFDVVQLELTRSVDGAGPIAKGARSALYRVRKIRRDGQPPMIEVIESRALSEDTFTKPILIDTVVAAVPHAPEVRVTGMGLRWRQTAVALDDTPEDGPYRIDTVLRVVGPDDGPLYTTALPGQWADTLSIGVLDYNVSKLAAYAPDFDVRLDEVWLSAYAPEH